MKKVSIILCALLLALCCIFLIACDPDGSNFDKASQNKEFVSFRKKIVTILKDNDIFVNDLDKSVAKSGGGSEYAQATSLYADGGKSAIDKVAEIMMKDGYKSNEDYDFALKQIYTIALQMSICVGDGMLNYFDEKEFFNIPVYFPDMDIVITENGNKTCMYGYQKTSDSVEHIQKIEVVFNAENDYYFTVTEPTGDWMVTGDTADSVYFYGDSNKRFLMLRSGYEAIYASNGEDFYQTTDKKTLEDCLDALGSDVFEYDVAEYRKIKDNVKHTFTSEQVSALMDKYFKDVQSSTENRPSEFMYENFGGKNVLIGYYAGEGESEVVIPSNVKYISERFSIEDIQGSVKTLTVPASVTAIIDDNGNTQTDASYVNFALHRQEGEVLLQNITVAQGSSLFKSGSGHLRLKNGVCIYAVDKAGESLDWDVLMRARMQSNGDVQYRNIFTVNSDAFRVSNADITRLEREYEIPEDEVMQTMQKVMSSSQFTKYDISVSCADADLPGGDPNEGAFAVLSLAIELKSDVTINVTYDKMQPQDSAHCLVDLTNKSQTVRNVTVNTAGFAYQTYLCVRPAQPSADKGEEPQFVPNDKIQTAFNLDVSQLYYDGLCYGRLMRDVQNSQVNFDKKQDAEYPYFKITNANTNPNHSELYCDVGITGNVRDGENITVPSKLFGLPVRRVDLDVSALTGKNVTIALPNLDETDLQVDFYNSDENQDVVLKNDGVVITCPNGMQKLVSGMSTHDSDGNYAISITLRADGKTQSFQTGWEYGDGPIDDATEMYLRIDGQNTPILLSKRNGAMLLQNCEANTAYFAIPAEYEFESVNYKEFVNVYVDEQGNLRCDYDDALEGNYFILVSYPIGQSDIEAEMRDPFENFMLTVTFSSEVREGKTYFDATIASFDLSNGGQDKVGDCIFDAFSDVKLNHWFNLTYVKCSWEAVNEGNDIHYETFNDPGQSEACIVCLDGRLIIVQRNAFVSREITARINGTSVTQSVRIYNGQYQTIFNVDGWGLTDVDNYVFYMKFYNVRFGYTADCRAEIAFTQKDGSIYAICNGVPERTFTLEKYESGAKETELTNATYNIYLIMDTNFVKPTITVDGDNNLVAEFNKSLFGLTGTVEGRPVSGVAQVPYWYDVQYTDTYAECKHYWTFNKYGDELRPVFNVLDKYETVQINVGGNTYEKRVIPEQQFVINPEWLDFDANYAYFWMTEDNFVDSVRFNDYGNVVYYMPANVNDVPAISSLTLTRIIYNKTQIYDLYYDDENGNFYDLNITLTVTLDDSLAMPENVVTITASGRYNEGTIAGASDMSSLSSVSFVWDGGMETTPRRWKIELDGMDIKIVGLGKMLF